MKRRMAKDRQHVMNFSELGEAKYRLLQFIAWTEGEFENGRDWPYKTDPKLMIDLAAIFLKILKGADPKKALGIKHKRGVKGNIGGEKTMLAEAVIYFMEVMPYGDAVHEVCEITGRGKRMVAESYSAKKGFARQQLALNRAITGTDYHPLFYKD